MGKLSHYGIRGKAYDLINNYLSERSQYVYFDHETFSEYKSISCGVPQGSVLGPLLFILYINDVIYCQCKCALKNCIFKSDKTHNLFVLFADDCNTFVTDETTGGVIEKCNKLLNDLKDYIDANYLHINLKKSKFMFFRPPRGKDDSDIDDFRVKYDGYSLERVSSIKFLGIFIEQSLNWNLQVASVAKKLATVNGVLYQMRKTLPKSLRIAVFNALIQSHLSYGISVWGCGGDSNRLKKVFIAQKKAIRNAFGVRRVNKDIPGNTKIVFNNNNILTVHNIP